MINPSLNYSIALTQFRYVGTLHEINSETSTVALENVTSYGTEGRKDDPNDEIPPADSLYEYIVFRGSDVKDLRIEEAPTAKENKPPQVPNDPAILGVSARLFSCLLLATFEPMLQCDEIFRMLTIHSPRAQNRVEISVAFLLIISYPIHIIVVF